MVDEVVIGLDPHKASNTIAVLDRAEKLLARRRFVHSDDGLVAMFEAVTVYPKRVWAVEGANGIGRSIAQRLVAGGETVVDVPAKLATRVRVYSTGHGTKTDATDAVAIARAAIHSRHLRHVQPDGVSVALKLWSDRRRELVGLRTQAVCRLHRLLRELIPGGGPTELTAEQAFDVLSRIEATDPVVQVRVEVALDHIDDITRLDAKIDQLVRRITAAVKAAGTTVTRIYGIGPLNAAVILGDVGDVSRFPTRDHFASYTGTAPIAVSSGDHHRHRLSRSGNRRLNHAIHIAAIVQIRHDTPGRAYYRRKLAQGHSNREALRCLKRRISDAIWRQLQLDANPTRPKTAPGRAGHPPVVATRPTARPTHPE
jgi:transposase